MKSFLLTGAIAVAATLFAAPQSIEVKDHEPSLLPPGNWKLAWHDEFDGTELDRTKWDYRLAMMGERHPAWTDKGVHLDGKGNVVFTIVTEDGCPRSSQLQTGYNFMDEPVHQVNFCGDPLFWKIGKLKKSLFTHTYGYYEVRCRLQQHPEAWWTAFWLQSPVIGSSLDPAESGAEIDIMECFKSGNIDSHNVFTAGYGVDSKRASCGGKDGLDPEEFHRFGVLWDENGYTFYVDGVEDGHIPQYVSKRPEFILISTEIKGYRKSDRKAVPIAGELVGKDDFVVDYVRVFDRQ
ncbi:MAG: glycoside hydrolase family 16 protein [Victivallaceae bacterium]|nr:glycoside hydrolase family 16 protein [Victivallaceae bacterium]